MGEIYQTRLKFRTIFYDQDQSIVMSHLRGVHQGVASLLTPSLSPLLSMRVLSLVGANLSSLVDLSKFSYLMVLAM